MLFCTPVEMYRYWYLPRDPVMPKRREQIPRNDLFSIVMMCVGLYRRIGRVVRADKVKVVEIVVGGPEEAVVIVELDLSLG